MGKLWQAAAVLFTVTLAAPAEAQFGIRGGINLSKFIGDDAGEADTKQGLNFGGSFRLFGVGPLSIVPEVFYSQKGAKIEEGSGQGFQQLDFSLNYLEVPILARLNLPEVGMLQPYVAAGPAFAWQLDCELDVETGDVESDARECGEQFGGVDTAFQNADRGLVVTGGVDLRLFSTGGLNLEARLVQGLDRLNEGDDEPDVRNQAISLMLGYSFGI